MRRRVVIGLALVALALIAFLLWPRRHADRTQTAGSASSRDPHVPLGSAADSRRLWLALRGSRDIHVAGTVIRDGAPVAGASVRLASVASSSGLIAEPKVTTDAAGHFDFGTELAMEYVLVAEAPHVTGAMLELDPRLVPSTDDLVLVLHACDASIHGTVRDVSGGVVPKARISRLHDDSIGAGVDASDDGTYELCVEVGFEQVLVAADGYAQITDRVTAYGPVLRNFELSPEAALTGRVVRADDHTPVAHAIVEVTTFARLAAYGASERRVATDADGNFHVEGLAPGAVNLRAHADRLASPHAVNAVAEVGKSQGPVVCVVVPTLTISGNVIDASDKTPVADITVRLGGFNGRFSNAKTVSRADGSFELEDVLPGVYSPYVEREMVAGKQRRLHVDKADVTGVTIEVERGASIEGRVTRGGKPVDGVQVSARPNGPSGLSDHEGRFAIHGVKAATYRLYAESKRAGAFTNGPEISVIKGEHRTGVHIELDLAASVAGVVVDQNDAPVPGVVVRFSLVHGTDFGTATTADDGTFIARALSGGGDYGYAVQVSDESPLMFKPADGRRFAPIGVKDGSAHVTGLRIRVRVDRLTISGHVLDAAGNPVPDVNVSAIAMERYGWAALARPATTDARGAFTLRGMMQGRYTVIASSPSGGDRVENVEAGRNDVTLRFAALGGIEGTLDGFGADVEVSATSAGPFQTSVPAYATTTDKTLAFSRLPAGPYQVWARSSTGQDVARVTVTAGSTARVALHNHHFGAIEGTFRDAAGAPESAATCSSSGAGYAETDDTGSFRIDDVPAASVRIGCCGATGCSEADATVVSDQTVHVDLVLQPRKRAYGYAGMLLEDNLGEISVHSVAAGGPAARAGILAGDVIESVDGTSYPAELDTLIARSAIGTTIKITLSRGDKQLTVSLTTEAQPP